ncbi:MAG: hypothetical protein R2774_07240 [Saprospiraceae bacterium]
MGSITNILIWIIILHLILGFGFMIYKLNDWGGKDNKDKEE